MLSGNSLRQTVHTRRASVHQAAKVVATLLRVVSITQAWRKVMVAYCRPPGLWHIVPVAKSLFRFHRNTISFSVLFLFCVFVFWNISYLKSFRTEQCKEFTQHRCNQRRPYTCFNWHFPNQRRRRPIRKRDGSFNYSAKEYCSLYNESNGICPNGDR